MGLALYELYEISELPTGNVPYEVYVPMEEELHLLRAQSPLASDTYWELMCHFHICGQITKRRNQDVKQKACAEDLLLDIDTKGVDITPLLVCTETKIEDRIAQFVSHAYVAKSKEDVFKIGTSFDSLHHQAKYPLSLLKGFLMLWLKRYVTTLIFKPLYRFIPYHLYRPGVRILIWVDTE